MTSDNSRSETAGRSARDMMLWALEYHRPSIVRAFEAIPDEWLCVPLCAEVNPPGWTFGHIVVTERLHVGRVLEGVDDVPAEYGIFRVFDNPDPAQLARAIPSKQTLIGYWRDVREKTRAYLARISDADLNRIPEASLLADDDPNRDNPVCEWLIMTIQHQYSHLGHLETLGRLVAAGLIDRTPTGEAK